jgi:hypothetical protein
MLWHSISWYIDQRQFWLSAYFSAAAAGACLRLASRDGHLGAFLLPVLTASVLETSLIMCLVQTAGSVTPAARNARINCPTRCCQFCDCGLKAEITD